MVTDMARRVRAMVTKVIRKLRFAAVVLSCALACAAQEPSSVPANPPGALNPAPPEAAAPPEPDKPAQLEGTVLNDSTGEPLRRVRVTLHPLEADLPSTGTEADDQGHFLLRDIPKGTYNLTAERDGFLTSAQPLTAGLRMPPAFELKSGENISDITFRLRPWAVLSGRIRYDDGEFGVGVRVQVYRTDHIRGRSAYSLAATTTANDRGEYRIYGLVPGAYLLAASNDAPTPANYREEPTVDAEGREQPLLGYMTTFYPNTELMSQAVAIRLNYGQELGGIDLYLRQARKVTLSGRVIDGVTGTTLTGASISLERVDASGSGTMSTNAAPKFDQDGGFSIPNVSPGSYAVFVKGADDSGTTVLTGHTVLAVGTDDVTGIDLVATPSKSWAGRIVAEGPGVLPPKSAPRISVEPRSMDAQVCTANPTLDAESGEFEFTCDVSRDETYDVFAENLPGDYYLSAVRVGGADVKAFGLPGSIASGTPFEVVLDSRGGRVSGAVAGSDGVLWGGATLMLIPDPAQHRLQDYRFVYADAHGRFLFHGVAPGNYTLVAWLDQAPCDVYDPGGLDRCRSAGTSVTVNAGIEENLVLTMRSTP
jgi:hypothetical protein